MGRFELRREVGRGGFGVVWEARDRELGRTVAFKVVRAGRDLEMGEELLLREAEAVARLSHPNIVTLFDVGRSAHGPYLVLELLQGETLAVRLKRGPIPAAEAVRIAAEVARGLAHAHAHGVVHRDLTPGNVFLCSSGQVKILDLGLAHAFGRRKVDGGTPAYMAPEQWRGAPEDERTDVFALGVILHQMLSGALPFPDREGRSATGPDPAPVLRIPEAPGLADLVSRALEKDPVRRPRDASWMADDLDAVRQQLRQSTSSRGVVSAAGGPLAREPRRRLRLAAALAALLALGLGGYLVGRRSPRTSAGPSIAVLPFADMSPDRDQRHFSDGLAEEILNALAHVDGLRVAGRTSSFSFRDKAEDLRSIGHKLGVSAVLEGSVRRSGNRLRVSAQLVDVADGYHLWSETYDRDLTDIFAVQDEIARQVVAALKVRVLAGQPMLDIQKRATQPEVYAQVLLGRQFYGRRSGPELRSAVAAYEKALALDASYAPAWAGLAMARAYLADSIETAAGLADEQRKAMEAAEQAVALAPDLAEARSARGYLRASIRRDFEGARADLERALVVNPGNADTMRIYATSVLGPLGRRADAMALLRRVTDLDPLSDSAWQNLAFLHNAFGETEQARAALRRALEIAPDDAFAYSQLATSFVLDGNGIAAQAAAERCSAEQLGLTALSLAAHVRGDRAGSDRNLGILADRWGHGAAYQIAQVHAWRGETDEAFTWLDRAMRQHDAGLIMLKNDPLLRPLRPDPRFRALLQRMNLPPD